MLRKKFAFIFPLFLSFVILSLSGSVVLSQTSSNFAGVGVDPSNPGGQPDPADLKEMGVGMVRVVYRDDAWTNAYISDLVDNGITPVLVLNWEANDSVWNVGGDMTFYSYTFQNSVVQPAVNKYGNNVVYQVWNEPDGVQGTKPLSAQQYYTLLSATYETIKNNSENNKVITAGLVSGDMGYVAQLMALSGGNYLPADGIGYHPYVYNLDAVRNGILSLANGTGLPVWITEFGLGPSATEDQQAKWIRSVFGLSGDSALSGSLQSVMWYAWSDAMNAGFGLVDADGKPKQELTAFLEAILGELPEGFLDRFDFSPIDIPEGAVSATPICTDCGITVGDYFIIRGNQQDIDNYNAGSDFREIAISHFETGNINIIGSTMDETFKTINLPENQNNTRSNESRGYVEFYYCQKGTYSWPQRFEGEVVFEVPGYYEQAATSTYQYADMMTSPENRSANSPQAQSSQIQFKYAADNDKNLANVLGGKVGSVLQASDTHYFIVDPNSSCTRLGTSVSCNIGVKGVDTGWNMGHMTVLINGSFIGINKIPGSDMAYNEYSAFMDNICPAAGECDISLQIINFDLGVEGGHAQDFTFCSLNDNADSCGFTGGGEPPPPPEPPYCDENLFKASGRQPMTDVQVPTYGVVRIGALNKLISDVFDSLKQIWNLITSSNEYLVFPIIHHPYTNASEIKFRHEASMPFTLPEDEHDQIHAEIDIKYENKESDTEKQGAVYGSTGWDKATKYDIDMVSLPE